MAENSNNLVTSDSSVSQTDINGSVKVTCTPNIIFRTSSVGESAVIGTQLVQNALENLPSSNHSSNSSTSTITLGCSESVSNTPSVVSSSAQILLSNGTLSVSSTAIQQQKKTSFQITSVTVDSSASNDGGDDSADELDESHTEDSQEVVTDLSRNPSEVRNSIPTEENFTRNDVFFNPAPPSAMSSAPVIPTSSQYGLAIVDEAVPRCSESSTSLALPENNLSGEKNDYDHVHNRFKVVKIVSTEPFKKGRWMCMDYFDQTVSTTAATATSNTSSCKDSGSTQSQQQPHPYQPSQQTHQPPQPNQPPQTPQQLPQQTQQSQQQSLQQNHQSQSQTQQQQQSHTQQQQQPHTQQQSHPQQQQQHTQQQSQPQQPQAQQQPQNQQQQQIHQNQSQVQQQQASTNPTTHQQQSQHPQQQQTSPQSQQQPFSQTPPQQSHQQQHPQSQQNQQTIAFQQAQNTTQPTFSQPNPVHTGLPIQTQGFSMSGTQQMLQQQPQQMAHQQNQMIQSHQVPKQPQQSGQVMTIPQQGQNMVAQPPIASNQQPQVIPQQSQIVPQILQGSEINGIIGPPIPSQAGLLPQSQGMIVQNNMPQQSMMQSIPQNNFQQQQQQAQNQVNVQPNIQTNMQQGNMHQPTFQTSQQSVTMVPQTNPQSQPMSLVQPQQSQQIMPQSQPPPNMQQNIPGQLHGSSQSQPTQQNQSQQMVLPQQQQQVYHTQQTQPLAQQQQPLTQAGQSMPPQIQQNTVPMQSMHGILSSGNPTATAGNIANENILNNTLDDVSTCSLAQIETGLPGDDPDRFKCVNKLLMNATPASPSNSNSILPSLESGSPLSQHQQSQQHAVQLQQATNTMYPQPTAIHPAMQIGSQGMPIAGTQQMLQQPSQQMIQQQTPMIQSQVPVQPQQQGHMMAMTQHQQSIVQQAQINQSQPPQGMAQSQMVPQLIQNSQMIPPQIAPQPGMISQAPAMMPPQSMIQSIPQNSFQQQTQSQMNPQNSMVQGTMQQPASLHQAGFSQPPTHQQQPMSIIQPTMPLVQQQPAPQQSMSMVAPPQQQLLPQSQASSMTPAMQPSNLGSVQLPQPSQSQQALQTTPPQMGMPVQQPLYHTQPMSQQQTQPAAPLQLVHNIAPNVSQPPPSGTLIDTVIKSAIDDGSTGSASTVDTAPPSEDGDSASGTNTVAIDNKIEQAMDLVKSHLMFAVREEVEVLKEKISELMERITQLEYENTILRANATQETLAQIQSKTNQLHGTGGNSNVSNNNS